jgi:hypothetical protein
VLPGELFSYIDPVSGAIVLQLIMAGAVGVVAFFRRSLWALCRTVLRLKGPDSGNPKSAAGAEWNFWWIAMATSCYGGLHPSLGPQEGAIRAPCFAQDHASRPSLGS